MHALAPDELIDSKRIGYSQGIDDDGTLFLSGQVGWDEQFDLAGDDMASQAARAFENIGHLLAAADRSLEDIRKVTAYLVDAPATVEAYLEAHTAVFETEPYPCLTILGVESLAQSDMLVELEVEVA